ncbi:hypothetical protein GCM10010381_00360 [Streptomyces xantholiticus]|nr:hypothetical protein GCM10010381_00360 [Streptomyces xantholiticus]
MPRELRTAAGVVFQQPRMSADPRLSLCELTTEPLRATGRRRAEAAARTEEPAAVGLTCQLLGRRPREVSDGQRQRAGLARAPAPRPRRLVRDGMTPMLDASTTAALVAVVENHRREDVAMTARGRPRPGPAGPPARPDRPVVAHRTGVNGPPAG